MNRTAIASFAASLALTLAAFTACSSFGSDSTATTDDAATDAPGGDAATADAAMGDGGAGDGACKTIVADFSAAQGWKLEGSATVADGGVTLVTETQDDTGAAYLPLTETASSFDVTFRLSAAQTAAMGVGVGEGAALAWASNMELPLLGRSSENLAFCLGDSHGGGPIGNALGFEMANEHVVLLVSDGANSCPQSGNPQPHTFAATQQIHVVVKNGHADVDVGASSLPTAVPIVAPIRYLGFTGSTGLSRAIITIDQATITLCR